MKNSLLTLFVLHFFVLGMAQNTSINFAQNIGFVQNNNRVKEISYEVRNTYNKRVSKKTLNTAKVIKDINAGYPSSWINEYISVEISAICNGKPMKATGKDDQLNAKQLAILQSADIGTNISIFVKYAESNTIKTIDFFYTIIPTTEATYIGGYEDLSLYLKKNAIDKLSKTTRKNLALARVKFTINEDGTISDTQIIETSGNETTDAILLNAINAMKAWQPAKDLNGKKVKQEFQFSVGTMMGC